MSEDSTLPPQSLPVSIGSEPEKDTRATAKFSNQAKTTTCIFVITALLILSSGFINSSFGGLSQLQTILYLSSFLVFCAFGQGIVIMVRGLDLSIASVITLGGVLTATLMNGSNDNLFYIIPLVMLLCASVGVVSGIGVAIFQIPPFIMTMAVGLIVYSLCLGYTNGSPKGYPAPYLSNLMQASFFGISSTVFLLLIFTILGTIVQSYSTYGRQLNAIGDNPRAALIAGLPTKRLTISAYVISAFCAGFTGIVLAGYANGATLRMGDDYLLPSIAAVVVGGSSILGGRGLFLGTVGGAILLTTLSTILSALGIEQGWKTIIEGGVILIALIALREQSFQLFQNWVGRTMKE